MSGNKSFTAKIIFKNIIYTFGFRFTDNNKSITL